MNIIKAILVPPLALALVAVVVWAVGLIPETWLGIVALLIGWVVCSLIVYHFAGES